MAANFIQPNPKNGSHARDVTYNPVDGTESGVVALIEDGFTAASAVTDEVEAAVCAAQPLPELIVEFESALAVPLEVGAAIVIAGCKVGGMV